MRIATYRLHGQRLVGQLSGDSTHVTAFDTEPALAERGVLPLVERAAAGAAWPALGGEAVPLSEVQLEAPMPRPRRSLFCVGRNYHAHALELRESVFKDSPKDTQAWPIFSPTASISMPAPFRMAAASAAAGPARRIGVLCF